MTIKEMEVVLADGDDWQGLYVNGTLVTQDNLITVQDLCDLYDFKGIIKEVYADVDWLSEVTVFPKKLEDVKLEEDN